jgi:hypothetical protein
LFDITSGNTLHTKNQKIKNIFLFIAILWLIIHDGLRWGIGTDWNNYYDYFKECLSASDKKNFFELGYILSNQIIRYFTEDYTVFLLFHAILVYLFLRSSVIKYSPLPFVSLLLFYGLMLPYLGMNRQYIALAISIFSYKYILERKIIFFIITIAIASFFHISAILFFPAYLLTKQIPTKIILILIIAVLFLALSGIINRISNIFFGISWGSIGERIRFYFLNRIGAESVGLINTFLALTKRVGIIILILAMFKSEERNTPELNLFLNSYIIATLLYISFNNTYLQVIIGRGLLFFNIAEIFLVPFILLKFKRGFFRLAILLLFVSYGWIQIQKGFNNYEKMLGVDIFRPYNSALINKEFESKEIRR